MNTTWKTAITATLHCLTGCAIGEILGMSIGVGLNWHYTQVIILAIILSFIFGYSFTIWSLYKSGVAIKQAFKLALASDTISIATMELVDNIVILFIPRSMSAGILTWHYWVSLLISMICAFIVAVPVNKLLIAKGLGHAKIHQHMHHNMDHMNHQTDTRVEVNTSHNHMMHR